MTKNAKQKTIKMKRIRKIPQTQRFLLGPKSRREKRRINFDKQNLILLWSKS